MDKKQFSSSSEEDIVVTNKNGLLTLRLNRPKKYNAITSEMYLKISDTLESAAKDSEVKLALLTGTGSYYSAGNDLTAFVKHAAEPVEAAKRAVKILDRFIGSYIDFPKPIVAAVNGPAIGITVTTLALMDIVWAAESSTFSTPFSATAQSPEGCSSLLFPAIMGASLANEMVA